MVAMAKGYAVILLDVRDADLYADYAKQATSVEARYGGRPIVAGNAEEIIDGTWPAQRIVILEFSSLEQARRWYTDPEYEALIPLRHQATRSQILLIEQFASDQG
jgi:uncharacterized protein (DUF1330 family)